MTFNAGLFLSKLKSVLLNQTMLFAFGLSAKLMPKALELLFSPPLTTFGQFIFFTF
jgi:hypothetical protein